MAYLTIDQTAKVLAVHPETVRRMIKAGRLPDTKLGRVYRIKVDSLDELNATEPQAPP